MRIPVRRAAIVLALALALAAGPPPAPAEAGPVCASPTGRSVWRTPVLGDGPVCTSPTGRSVRRTPVRAGGGRPDAVTYQAPVAAVVSDPFRAPATPYGPGNRGLEYATSPGRSRTAAT